MLYKIIENIKGVFDMTVFITLLSIGLFALLVDYPFFKTVKYKRDAGVTRVLGIAFVILPFALLIISMF